MGVFLCSSGMLAGSTEGIILYAVGHGASDVLLQAAGKKLWLEH